MRDNQTVQRDEARLDAQDIYTRVQSGEEMSRDMILFPLRISASRLNQPISVPFAR